MTPKLLNQAFLAKITIIKLCFFSCRGEQHYMYVPIFRGLDARGGRKLRTHTHNYSKPHCTHARRGLIKFNTRKRYSNGRAKASSTLAVLSIH